MPLNCIETLVVYSTETVHNVVYYCWCCTCSVLTRWVLLAWRVCADGTKVSVVLGVGLCLAALGYVLLRGGGGGGVEEGKEFKAYQNSYRQSAARGGSYNGARKR